MASNELKSTDVNGALTVDRDGAAAAANLIITGDAGQQRNIRMSTAGSLRWILQTDSVAEGGSDVGSDFNIARYSDAGAFLAKALTIDRADGTVAINGPLTLGASGVNRLLSLHVPTSAMTAAAVGPGSSLKILQSGAVEIPVLHFDQSTIEAVGFTLTIPDDYDGGDLVFRVYWTGGAAATAGNVVWAVKVAVFDDDEPMGVSPTVDSGTDAWTADGDCQYVDLTVSPNGATAGDTLLTCYLYRNATSGSDTLDADADLIGIRVTYA